MKEKIAIVTDSSTYLTEEELKREGIFNIPIILNIGNNSYKELLDISEKDFLHRLATENAEFKTSQPSLGDLISLYEEISKTYDTVIALHCSKDLSGTMRTSAVAAKLVGIKHINVDTCIASYPLRKAVLYARDLVEEGVSSSDIEKLVLQKIADSDIYAVPASLERLKKSGRVSSVASLIVGVIDLKLILGFNEGKVIVKEKFRGEKKTKRFLIEKFGVAYNEGYRDIAVLHVGNIEKANSYAEEIKQLYPEANVEVNNVSAVIGTHIGVGSIGISWVK